MFETKCSRFGTSAAPANSARAGLKKIQNFKVHPGPKSHTSIWKIFYQVPQKGRPMFRLLLIVAQQEQPTPPSRP